MSSLEYHIRDPKTHAVVQVSAEAVGELIAMSTKPVFITALGRDAFTKETPPDKIINCMEGYFEEHKPEDVLVISVSGAEKKISDSKLTNYIHRFNDGLTTQPWYDEAHDPKSYGANLLRDCLSASIEYANFCSDAEHEKLFQKP